MEPIHRQVLDAANRVASTDGTFRVNEILRALPHLNPATVRTHVSSRCCVNAPAHHASRYRYFRAVRRGVYRIEPGVRRRERRRSRSPSQDIVLATLDSGVDTSLLRESLAMAPTERIEAMRKAALSLEELRSGGR